MGSRKKEFTLVLCLLLLGGGIALESESLVPPLFSLKVPAGLVSHFGGTGPSNDVQPGSGDLLVRVFLNATSPGGTSSLLTKLGATGPGSLSPQMTPTSASFSVVQNGNGPFTPNVYTTNSTGEIELKLKVTDYSILFYDLPTNITVPLSVRENSVTELNLTITSETYSSVYLSLPSDNGSIIPPWSQGTIEVSSPVSLFGSAAAFLNVHYAPGSGLIREVESPLIITGLGTRSPGLVSLGPTIPEWIGFIIKTPVSLAGMSSADLSVFTTSTRVAIHPMNLVQLGGI